MTALVAENWWNQRYLDDWLFVPDIDKFYRGELSLRDILAPQMEHRIALPRVLVILLTWLFHGDVRAQNVLCLMLVWGSFAVMGWFMLRRRTGLSIRESCLPLFLAGAIMFSPLQWQILLWGICFTGWLPGFFLLLVVAVFVSSRSNWLKLLLGAPAAVLSLLSFGAGLATWILPGLAMGRTDMGARKRRLLFFAAWLGLFCVSMILYLHNLRNTVPANFAYGQGEQPTMGRNFADLVSRPLHGIHFFLTFCGAILVRGLPCDVLSLAPVAGAVFLLLVGLLLVWVWRNRQDQWVSGAVLPWVPVLLYAPFSGALVTLGRAWVTKGAAPALAGRYSTLQLPSLAAMVVMFFLIARVIGPRVPRSIRRFGWAATGAFMMLIAVQWAYGASMMTQWQAARMKNSAAQLFDTLRPRSEAMRRSGVPLDMVSSWLQILAQHHLTPFTPLPTPSLAHFKQKASPLPASLAAFEGIEKQSDNTWVAKGYALLPGRRRTPEAVLFAWRKDNSEWTIFGFLQSDTLPTYLRATQAKDVAHMTFSAWGSEVLGEWWPIVDVISPPPAGAEISAWALDVHERSVAQILPPPSKRSTLRGVRKRDAGKPR
ncbi:MAG: hypothetical protein ACR2OZ_09640 [Verrucomicrobiales bacterium]